MAYLPRLQHLAAWLLLMALMLTRISVPKISAWYVGAAGLVLLVASLPNRRLAIPVLPFILIPIVATYVPLPVPGAWPGLVRLGILLVVWCTVALLLAAAALRLSSPHDIRQRSD